MFKEFQSNNKNISLFCMIIYVRLFMFVVTHNGDQMPILLSRLLQRDKPTDMQMQAAKWWVQHHIETLFVILYHILSFSKIRSI